jgi:hypothetical protein
MLTVSAEERFFSSRQKITDENAKLKLFFDPFSQSLVLGKHIIRNRNALFSQFRKPDAVLKLEKTMCKNFVYTFEIDLIHGCSDL